MLLFLQKKESRNSRIHFMNFYSMVAHLEIVSRNYYGSYELGVIDGNQEIVFFRTHNEEYLYVFADSSRATPTFMADSVSDLYHLTDTYQTLLEGQIIEEVWAGCRIPFTNIGDKKIALYFIKEELSAGSILYRETDQVYMNRQVLTMTESSVPNWQGEGF